MPIIIFYFFQAAEQTKDRIRFTTLTDEAQSHIINRFSAYEDALQGGASLFTASDNVTSAEWSRYLQNKEFLISIPEFSASASSGPCQNLS